MRLALICQMPARNGRVRMLAYVAEEIKAIAGIIKIAEQSNGYGVVAS